MFVDRDGRGVQRLGAGDDELVQFHNRSVRGRRGREWVRVETEIAPCNRTRGDGDEGGLLSLAREEHPDAGRAGRDLGEAKQASGVGEGLKRCAFDGDAGEFDRIAGAEVGDAALDDTGGGRLRHGGSGEEEQRQRREADAGHQQAGGREEGAERGLHARVNLWVEGVASTLRMSRMITAR